MNLSPESTARYGRMVRTELGETVAIMFNVYSSYEF